MRMNLIILFVIFVGIAFFYSFQKKNVSSKDFLIPIIKNFFPKKGTEGDTISIQGENFNSGGSFDTVEFNGVKSKIIYASDTNLEVILPLLANTGKLVVKTKNSSTASKYDFIIQHVNVYISGSIDIGGINKYVAAYWKNGNEVIIGNGNQLSHANSIDISGNNIYVAGFQGVPATAVYWKNGISILLSNSGFLTSIQHFNKDIYVLGTDNTKPTYWKNNEPFRLANSRPGVGALAVNDGDVYVAGYRADNGTKLAYWKNGAIFSIPGAVDFSEVTSICILGKDIYLAGRECIPNTPCSAKYWKSGIPVSLGPPQDGMIAKSIFADGNDLYVLGNDRGRQAPFFWKNGRLLTLEKSDTINCELVSIKVFEHNTYIIGTRLEGPKKIASCWKNGKLITNIDISPGTVVSDICIVKE